ncbi:hypothetical protein CBR_g29748 [Chara braunii]|uniref:Integrase zinc-binding domain-containing protein n=1 Tax=Chara braunii TaxID=69332 RepID=A0A388LBA6_CHABU|nr:hypothetical protein CBR_g29748 [Chara braunii]|eukprot:GBG79600.1 hypothetical protein CBR_g29748 [Chara braunii]
MPESGGVSDGTGKVLMLEDLIAAIDRHEKTPSNVPKVDTFHFNGERVLDWLDRVEQALVGLVDAVKFQRIMRYVLYGHHQEVQRVVNDANGNWVRFREGMQRKYRLGDDLLTSADLEAMNKDNFTTIGAFVQEFKKRARKVRGISEETQCVIVLGLLTVLEAQELTSHGGGSAKLTSATIDKGVEDGSLDQVEQHQGNQGQGDQGGQGYGRTRFDWRSAICQHCDQQGHTIRLCNIRREDEKNGLISSTVDGNIYDQFGEFIDRKLGGVRAEAQRRAATGPPPPATFRLWQEKEGPPIGVEEVGSDEEVTQGLREGDKREEPIIIESDDEDEEEKMEPSFALLGKMEDLLGKIGRYQQKLVDLCKGEREWRSNVPKVFLYDSGPESATGQPGVNVVGSGPRTGMMMGPLTPQARLAQAARTRSQAKATASQEPPRRELEPGGRKEAGEVEDDDDEEEEDERLRQEEQRAKKREATEGVESVLHDVPPKKKKYAVRLEEGFGVEKMMKLALAGSHSLVENMRTIEEGPGRVERHEELMGGMYLLVNTLLQENLNQTGSLNPAGNEDEVPESQDDEFEDGEIKEVFRAEEYEGIYLELGLLLSCEMWLRDVSDRAQRMMQSYLVRDDHLFRRREVGNPRRVICGRNRQIDVIAALQDDIAGGHRGIHATYAKISELYYSDGMMDLIGKFCRSCVPFQERSCLRPGEPLHPRLEREVGAVVNLDLLFMPLADQGYNYIFDARDNLSGFVDGRAIRTKAGPVLVSCIEEYHLRYPFVKEFVMDRGSEFTCQEVQELLSRSDFTKPAMPRGGKGTRPSRRPLGASGGYERHGPRHRESTPVYDDGDIELFLDSFWGHAGRMGWTLAQAIERLRGADRFEEPIARIRREATTRPEVMQELRPSPVGPDGKPIRLEIGNAEAFIPAFEWFMQGQEMWRDFWEQRGEEIPSPTRAGFRVARKAEERLDRKIRFLTKTTFDRYLLLESDLAGKTTKAEGHGLRLETMEVEIQELRALVASQAAIIEDLRQQLQGRADKDESSRQGEQRQLGQGLSGQPSATESCQESSMGRVILKPEEAKAKREAEREAFEFRAPTELATIVAAGPVMPLAVEEGLPWSSSETAQGSAEGFMDVLLEAVHTMQEEAKLSLFSPE